MSENVIDLLTQWAYQGVYYIVYHLTVALTALIQRSSWLYWPYVVSSLLIAAAVLTWRSRVATRRGADADLARPLSRALWWHRSARADYALYLANALILPLVLTPLLPSIGTVCAALGSPDCLSGATSAGMQASGAVGASVAINDAAAIALRIIWTLLFFIALEFGRFLAHCLLHDCPALWAFHRLHHSAQVLTPITAFRAHPVELLIMAWGPLASTAVVTLIFNRLSGHPVESFTFLGLHLLLALTNLIDNLRHSSVWVSYGKRVGRWLISPAHHQLHHSCEPRHMGCNRGFTLALWDRLYGTLYIPGIEPESFRLGLGDASEPAWHRLTHAYLQPFRECLSCLVAWVRGRPRNA